MIHMQTRPRRDEDVDSLPSLERSSNRIPPRSLRFNDEAPPPTSVRRRTSKLPELVRRESIISTYRSELYQPKMVTFMKNGNRFFEGVKLNVSSKNFRHWEVLLSELSRCIDLPSGVRHIYTPESGHRVTSLDQFQHQRSYVCASTEPFKRITYANAKTPTWHAGTRVRHATTGTLLDLGKSMQGLDKSLVEQNKRVDADSGIFSGQWEGRRERKRKKACVQQQLPHLRQEKLLPEITSPPRKQPSTTLAPESQPTQFTIICDGPPPRKVLTVFLDRERVVLWEQAHSLISGTVKSTNGCLRLYSVDGVEVDNLSKLWATNNVLISTGHGDFNITDFLQGNDNPSVKSEVTNADDAHTQEQQLLTYLVTDNVHMVPEGNQEQIPPNTDSLEQQGDPRDMRGRDDKTVGEEEMSQGRENKEIENGGERESGTERKTVILTPKKATSEPAESCAVPVLQVPVVTSPEGEQRPSEGPPSSSRLEPEESQVYPTNSMFTLTDDGSFIDASSPLTVAKAAVLQRIHRLSLPYNDDCVSVSGSDGSANTLLASRASVICPETPQSDISFSPRQSLVEMILPKENGFRSDMSAPSTSSSRYSSQPKSRTVGIQTDLIGDKLSAVIEEDQQPYGQGRSRRTRRLTHPLFHTQTSISSQMNATSSSSSHRQKDNYSLGPVQGEGRFAVVRECHHKMSGQQYSLRIISKARVFGQEDLVWRECEVLRCMRHENLVKVVDGWDSSDDIYMVVEHVEGTDLFDAVLHCQHFSEGDAILAMRQLSMALVFLHAHKIVHRDIKLENIFLHHVGEGEWGLKLGGMGLATTVSEPLSLICGTTYYMAPEMITEMGYGTKLDVWAAGVICCIVLSGIMPFGSNSKRATVSNIKRGRYTFLSPFWDKVSDKAKDFVRHLLVVSPHKRYMATQMLQHSWIEGGTWEGSEQNSELRRVLREHLVSKSTSAKNAALPSLIVTALDKRKALPNMDQHKDTHRQNKQS